VGGRVPYHILGVRITHISSFHIFYLSVSHTNTRLIRVLTLITRARIPILGDIHQSSMPVIAQNTVVLTPKRSVAPSIKRRSLVPLREDKTIRERLAG
jgi:hypothetical protein